MENNWIVTPDLYLAISGLFAAIMVARELVRAAHLRRARVEMTNLRRMSCEHDRGVNPGWAGRKAEAGDAVGRFLR